MTNPNPRFIEDQLETRADNARGLYYEVPDPSRSNVWEVRDSVSRAVEYLLGEPRTGDRYDILGKTLEKKSRKGFLRKMFSWGKRKLSNLFSGPNSRIGSTEMPNRNQEDFLAIVSTMRDVVPSRHLMNVTPPPDTDLRKQQISGLLGKEVVGWLPDPADPTNQGHLGDPEMAFVYRDLMDPDFADDYDYAIKTLTDNPLVTPPAAPATPTPAPATPTPATPAPATPAPAAPTPAPAAPTPGAPAPAAPTPATPAPATPGTTPPATPAAPGTPPAAPATPATPEPPTIFQLRLWANARRIARRRFSLLGKPENFEITPTPEDFKQAYVQTYLDHFEFENEDIRKATLEHAIKQLNEENNAPDITLNGVLKKAGFDKKIRKVLDPEMTDKELSEAIADGDVPLDEIPRLVAILRMALRSGRFDGKCLSLSENIGPLTLQLHKFNRLYRGLNQLENMDETMLKSETGRFLTLLGDEAEEARKILRTARTEESGVDVPEPEPEPAPAAAPEGEEGADKVSTLSEQLAERFKKVHENPFAREIMQFAVGATADWFLSKLRRPWFRRGGRR